MLSGQCRFDTTRRRGAGCARGLPISRLHQRKRGITSFANRSIERRALRAGSTSRRHRWPRLYALERQRQYLRKPCRCHWTTVAGLTRTISFRQRGQTR